jgi:predicted HNH restriction endonuclease
MSRENMSIEGKLFYREIYLKSEQWQTVRIEALAREKWCCQICKEELQGKYAECVKKEFVDFGSMI